MPITINGSGTVTGISAGGLPDDCIVTADIADNNVTTAKIANIGVTEIKIADGAVSQAKRSEDLTLETAKSATGTSVDFTGIPSWVKKITVMMNGVSTNGTSIVQIQLGNTSFVTSGYSSIASGFASSAATTLGFSSGFVTGDSSTAAMTRAGFITINNLTGNTWVANGVLALPALGQHLCSGAVTLSGTLDRVRITTVNGTDTFDAGTVNIMYE